MINRDFLPLEKKMAMDIPRWVATFSLFLFVFLGWTICFFIAIAMSAVMIREYHLIVSDPANHVGYMVGTNARSAR